MKQAAIVGRAVLWQGFQVNMGMIVDGLKATPCRKGHIERLSCHKRRHSMPCFVASAPHELSPVMMRLYMVFQARIARIWHGMVTSRRNYRTANAVIAQFYRRVCLTTIMGLVSFISHLWYKVIRKERKWRGRGEGTTSNKRDYQFYQYC